MLGLAAAILAISAGSAAATITLTPQSTAWGDQEVNAVSLPARTAGRASRPSPPHIHSRIGGAESRARPVPYPIFSDTDFP